MSHRGHPQVCGWASDHQAGCRVPDSKAPSRCYPSGHRPDPRGQKYTHAVDTVYKNTILVAGNWNCIDPSKCVHEEMLILIKFTQTFITFTPQSLCISTIYLILNITYFCIVSTSCVFCLCVICPPGGRSEQIWMLTLGGLLNVTDR